MNIYAFNGDLIKGFKGTVDDKSTKSLTVDASGLSNGMYTAKLVISANGATQSSVTKFVVQH